MKLVHTKYQMIKVAVLQMNKVVLKINIQTYTIMITTSYYSFPKWIFSYMLSTLYACVWSFPSSFLYFQVRHLGSFGGLTAEDVIDRIMSGIFTNNLASRSNWHGRGQKAKIGLSQRALAKVIKGTMHKSLHIISVQMTMPHLKSFIGLLIG